MPVAFWRYDVFIVRFSIDVDVGLDCSPTSCMARDKTLFFVVVYMALSIPAQTRPYVKWQQSSGCKKQ